MTVSLERRLLLNLILGELERAEKKYPSWPENRIEQVAIMVEEAGEALKAVLDCRMVCDGGKDGVYLADVRNELIQTAAMCIRCLENL